MQFLDEAKIYVKSGWGGDGCVSFRRERNIPLGGPNGGDGGRGGSVIFECTGGLNTLIDFRYQQHFKAKRGGQGEGSNRTGGAAQDVIIKVPVGTQILDEDKDHLIVDLTEEGQRYVIAQGGKGGLGNTHFKSSTNRSPRKFTKGGEGEEKTVWLRLKLLSDAGMLGLPNAGKSTFLAAVTRAKPKIADYPFTTLIPQLGVVYVDEKEFVLADIPGLIAGAAQGVGLGHRFLGHVERCGILLHLVDGTQEDYIDAYRTVRRELEEYSEDLAEKPEIVALNKCDSLSDDEAEEKRAALEEACGKPVRCLSSVARIGIEDTLRDMMTHIERHRKPEEDEDDFPIPA